MSIFKGANTTTQSDKVDSFQATVCEFGLGVPLLYGKCRTSVNLINYQDFTSTEHKESKKSGKSRSTSISYYYNCYLELAIGEAISSIENIWVGDKKYNDLNELNSGANIGNGTVANVGETINEGAPLQVNLGNNSSPTTYMQTKHPDIAVGYNVSYLYGYVYLGEDSASVPSYKVCVNGALQASGDGTDANPADVILDILTKLGLNGYVDTVSFTSYHNYCNAADLLISTPDGKFNNQTKAHDVIAELLELTNTYMYWNTDRFVFVPRDDRQHGTWLPNKQVVYDLTANDLELSNGGIVGFKRKDSRELYNHITVKFTNRANDYEQESITYQDVDNIRSKGIKSVTVEALWLHTKERAVKYAKALARKYLTEQNQYTLKLGWQYGGLTPGDLVRLYDEDLGLNGQVMMVSEVQEDNKGLLTVTAIQRPDGNYSEAEYTIIDNYSYQDFNIYPSDTADPLFIIPPADLVTSANGIEIWVALHGKTDTWGGCNVFISDKDSGYTLSGTQDVSSVYGTITSNMTASSTSVSVKFSNPKTVELLAGSQYDAEQGNTLIWVNGECMSYTQATLTAKNTYTLSGLIRGQYGTKKVAHSTGEAVAVLDGGIFVVPLTKHYQGRNLYFKFPSFNVFGANNQSTNNLDYYTCIANTADLPNCTNLRAYNKYREFADDVTRYDIVVEWTPPDFSSYQNAQIWYKTNNIQAVDVGTIPEGVSVSELGYQGKWIYAGQGYNTVTIPQAILGDTYKIAVCTTDIYNNAESPDMSEQVEILVALKTETPNTPANLSVNITDTFNISWDEVRNADVKYYEVRTDTSYGSDNNLLARTSEISISLNNVTNRTGNIYVYAVGSTDKCSAPATVSYNFPALYAPAIAVESKLQGIQCKVSSVPSTALGVHWYFEGTANTTDIAVATTTHFQSLSAGVYDVKACYFDYFGDGTLSGTKMVTISATIPPELIADESIMLKKLSADAQKAIEEGGLDTVNIAVKGLLGEGSALVLQPDGSYALVASNGETLTGMFANNNGIITLQGKYTHITGDTKIDGNVITNNMLAGGISANKIQADTFSALWANVGMLESVSSDGLSKTIISPMGGSVYSRPNASSAWVLRVRWGCW